MSARQDLAEDCSGARRSHDSIISMKRAPVSLPLTSLRSRDPAAREVSTKTHRPRPSTSSRGTPIPARPRDTREPTADTTRATQTSPAPATTPRRDREVQADPEVPRALRALRALWAAATSVTSARADATDAAVAAETAAKAAKAAIRGNARLGTPSRPRLSRPRPSRPRPSRPRPSRPRTSRRSGRTPRTRTPSAPPRTSARVSLCVDRRATPTSNRRNTAPR